MKQAIGIDLGGTNVKGILLDGQGNILHQHIIPTKDDVNGKWRDNVVAIVDYLKTLSVEPIDVIGLSCPGLTNAENNCIIHLPKRLEGLINFAWEDHFKIKTVVINDAHAALIAEAKFGALQGYKNAVLLTLGTGVGGGILINGELYQGQHQMAGHFGHTSINSNDDELSIIGMPGSLEYAIGNYSIERRSLGRYKSTLEVVEGYRQHDPFATWLWLDSIHKLALSIASISNSLSPEVIVLAGGITQAGDYLLKPLKDFFSLYEHWPGDKHTPVLLAKFSDLSGAIGAAAFAISKI